MKRNKIFAWMAVAMTFAACTNNDIADITANDDDNVVNIASVTRSGETGNTTAQQMTAPFHLVNVTQMAKFDMKYEADYTFDNNTYSVNGLVVWCNSYDNEFQAFSPLHTSANNASFTTFTIPTDQSTADKLAAADWMTATTTEKKGNNNGAISLNFEHQLSNIVITISEDAKSDLASLSDIKVLGTITPYYNSTAHTIQAIVEPATSVPNTSLLTFKDAAGESYTIPFPSSITSLDKGKQYNFTLSGGHNTLTISSVSVTDWQNTTISGKNEVWSEEDGTEYVTFTADSEQGFTFVKSLSNLPGLEYSVGNGAWTPIPDAGLTEPVKFGGTLGSLRLRGKSQYLFGTNSDRTVKFSNNTPVACSGDIRTLIDYTQYKTVDTGSAKFGFLFNGCTQLTTAPMLPATKLADNCYEGMFYGCTALTNAPALPATELTEKCYYRMFYGCTALKSAPALPAEQLAKWCYYSMFYGCTALKSAPALPATELADNCYQGMFNGCTALKSAPALPAEKLALFCYNNMFNGCTALTQAPELKASTIKTSCYSYMFDGCSNLSSVTMLAEDVSVEHYLMQWLKNAGTSAQSRTLKLKNSDVYNALKSQSNYLPDNWKSDSSGTTIIFEE